MEERELSTNKYFSYLHARKRWPFRPEKQPHGDLFCHGEHPIWLIIDIASKVAIKLENDVTAVEQTFHLLDVCEQLIGARQDLKVPLANAAATFLENGQIEKAVQRALALLELCEEGGRKRHSLRVRRNIKKAMLRLAAPSKSLLEAAEIITGDSRPDRSLPKLREFLLALAIGDIPDGVDLHSGWVSRPPSDPAKAHAEKLFKDLEEGRFPRGELVALNKPFAAYWARSKTIKNKIGGKARQNKKKSSH